MLLCKNQLSVFLWKGFARNCQTKVRLVGNTPSNIDNSVCVSAISLLWVA